MRKAPHKNSPVGTRQPRELDWIISDRIRYHRLRRNRSQEELADFLGISFQAVGKYEACKSRCSASTLHAIAEYLDYPLALFFKPRVAVTKARELETA